MKLRLTITSLLAGACIVACPLVAQAQQASTQQALTLLARDGKSALQIVLAPDAPNSVKAAAQDLQRYIEKSTKAKLPMLTQSAVPRMPFISLGDTAAARAAGLNTQEIALEGFRIVTRNGNIFILGPDTDDATKTAGGGTSNGTANGVYTFLEDYLNIRWLLPGEMGEDVPALAAVAIPNIDRTEAPFFLNRRVPGMQNTRPAVEEWSRRHKLGFSMFLNHAHNWNRVVPPEMHAQHPEWFAEIGGKRSPVVGDRYKLETTNPGLIQHYAQTAINAFRANPETKVFSLSATDSANWSQSAASLALYDKDPHGGRSVTPLVLKFYNDVARIVGREFPDRKLAGYVYADHLYPPSAGVGPLEPNLFLVVAPSISYGYQLYRPSVQKDWEYIMQSWSSQTESIAYYDLFNWLKGNTGAITPPATEILNFAFPRLVKYKMKGVYIYGTPEWSQAAVNNYVNSKMAWNPRLDSRAVVNEFYRRAYGEAAATHIQRLNDVVEASVKQYYQKDLTANYTATPGYMKDVLAANYPQIESLYLQAQQSAATKATANQRARLQFFGDNLIVMQWQLRSFGFLPDLKQSVLYRTDAQIDDMMGKVHSGFGVVFAPGFSRADKTFPPVRAELATALPNARPVTPAELRSNTKILFFPTGDDEIQVKPAIRAMRSLIRYDIYDASGKKVTGGTLRNEDTVRFTTSANQIYYMEIAGGTSIYQLQIDGAPYALAAGSGDEGLHFNSKTTPLYFRVPADVRQFTVTTNSAAPGEPSVSEIYSPSGKLVQTLSTQTTPVSRATITREMVGGEWEGFWCISTHAPPAGSPGQFDDVFVSIDKALPQWFIVDPARPLNISSLE